MENESLTVYVLSMGNPHCVIRVSDADKAPVKEWGEKIGKHERFPQGVNVSFMEIVSTQEIKLRVFERGAGETLACGSAACASAVAAILQAGMETDVTVRLPGGALQVSWKGANSPVLMKGPAVFVFDGTMVAK